MDTRHTAVVVCHVLYNSRAVHCTFIVHTLGRIIIIHYNECTVYIVLCRLHDIQLVILLIGNIAIDAISSSPRLHHHIISTPLSPPSPRHLPLSSSPTSLSHLHPPHLLYTHPYHLEYLPLINKISTPSRQDRSFVVGIGVHWTVTEVIPSRHAFLVVSLEHNLPLFTPYHTDTLSAYTSSHPLHYALPRCLQLSPILYSVCYKYRY